MEGGIGRNGFSKSKFDECKQEALRNKLVWAEDDQDPKCKLPLYLSEYALFLVNTKKDARASFQMSKEEFYEGVCVVNTSTLVSAVDNSTTYDITFIAFLPADETAQTFVTKVVATHADESYPTTEIRFLSISGKPPVFDDGEDSEEDLSECNERDSEEDLSESNQQDSKDLYEPDEKDSEENISKFDEEDTKTSSPYFLGGSKLFSQLNKISREGSELIKEINSFNKDVAQSDGFEVGYYPHMEAAGVHGTWIFKNYDIANTTLCPNMNMLIHLSQLALCVYNMKEDTYFDNVKVLKAMTFGGAGTNYNITFEASSHDKNAKVFQSRMLVSFLCPYKNIEVMFVRIKRN